MNAALISLALISGFLTFLTPCGLAMLPAYVSYYLGRGDSVKKLSWGKRLMKGLTLGAWAGLGIVSILSLLGLAIVVIGNVVKPFIPWLTIVGALFIIVVGFLMLVKKNFSLSLPIGVKGSGKPTRSFYSYGVIYGLAVMSCSLPIFLAVTLGALSAGGVVGGITVFSFYAGAAGLSMILFSLALSAVRESMLRFMKGVFPYFQKAAALVIILAGVYLIYYQIAVNRALSVFGGF